MSFKDSTFEEKFLSFIQISLTFYEKKNAYLYIILHLVYKLYVLSHPIVLEYFMEFYKKSITQEILYINNCMPHNDHRMRHQFQSSTLEDYFMKVDEIFSKEIHSMVSK